MVFPREAKWWTRLRMARNYRRLSQEQAAEAIGISRRTYARYEAGTYVPNDYTQKRLATLMEEPQETLFMGAGRT